MSLHLTTVLEPRGPAGAIVLTEAHLAELGASKRSPVTITVGDASIEGRIGVMGGEILVGLAKAARAALGVEIGQTLDVTLSVDSAPREITVPRELAATLARTQRHRRRTTPSRTATAKSMRPGSPRRSSPRPATDARSRRSSGSWAPDESARRSLAPAFATRACSA